METVRVVELGVFGCIGLGWLDNAQGFGKLFPDGWGAFS